MQNRVHTAGAVKASRDDVERALANWLDEHAHNRAGLSAWESHCFAMVLTFLCYGYNDRALKQLAFVLEPPTPLPVFPMRHLMSLDELLRALPQGVHRARSGRERPSPRRLVA